MIIDEVPHFADPAARSLGDALAGMGVATGRASGAARVIYHPDEGAILQAGDVLVASSTDPGCTPLFLRASAIVMETDGFSSHGAIVAREYGIPGCYLLNILQYRCYWDASGIRGTLSEIIAKEGKI